MANEAAFLQDVIAHPNDDAPRLVFADWLDERGESARAEFIRLQCERARLPLEDEKQSPLQARELRLLAAHSTSWRSGHPLLHRGRFRRGFIEFVQASAKELLEQGSELFTLAPIRDVCLTDLGQEAGAGARLASFAGWERIETLRINDFLGEPNPLEESLALLLSPHLHRLRSLTLICSFGVDALRQVLAQPALARLQSLTLNSGEQCDAVAALLGEFPQLPLTALSLHQGWYNTLALTPPGLQSLGQSGHWRRLTELDLGLVAAHEFFPMLADGLRYSQIHTLRLRNAMWGGPYGIEHFAKASSWGNLQTLGLSGYTLHGDQLAQLLASPHLSQLHRLHTDLCQLQADDLRAMVTCPALSNLTTFEVSGSFQLGRAGATALADAPALANVRDLRLWFGQMSDEVAVSLAGSPHYRRVRTLALGDNDVNAPGLRTLAGSPHLANLVRLRLDPVRQRLLYRPSAEQLTLDAATTEALANSPNLPNLTSVELWGNLFAEGALRPLLDSRRVAWTDVEPRRVVGEAERQALVERLERNGFRPPLDGFQEDDRTAEQ
jgi:uncharacterized protein (TIGR02996 family)